MKMYTYVNWISECEVSISLPKFDGKLPGVIATFSISVICFSDPFPLVYWLSILNGMWGMRIVDVILVLFCENRVIFKTSWSIEALLLGTSVVGSYTENGNIGKSGNRRYIIFLGGLIDVLEIRDR